MRPSSGTDGNPGEFCCLDGCPRRYCTAKQGDVMSLEESTMELEEEAGAAATATSTTQAPFQVPIPSDFGSA